MNRYKPRLAFISPVFLFPNDAGGKIRTTNILRGLRGGEFDVTLVCVATLEQSKKWAVEIDGVCDHFIAWKPAPHRPKWARAFDLFSSLPVNVANDLTKTGTKAVSQILGSTDFDLVIFDFVHSAILRPAHVSIPSICFTHNVEAEIFARHADKASGIFWKWVWRTQHAKMKIFEQNSLRRFDTVVAVSDRDAIVFREKYKLTSVRPIPTGVDLDFFSYQSPSEIRPGDPPTAVFTGSMDSPANIDGVRFFLKEVWPKVLAAEPDARFVVVGRNPPLTLKALISTMPGVTLTGFVDDVRPYVRNAHVFVIPLLVGGGTRIKAFEAMAMGCPIVSTSVGIEGLEARQGVDFIGRDDAESFASAILELFQIQALQVRISNAARARVEEFFGYRVAADLFEKICLDTLGSKSEVWR